MSRRYGEASRFGGLLWTMGILWDCSCFFSFLVSLGDCFSFLGLRSFCFSFLVSNDPFKANPYSFH